MKLGKIEISEALLKEEEIGSLKILFSEFIPLHIENRMYDLRAMIYTGYCDKFEDVRGELTLPPTYTITIDKNNLVFEKL